MGHTFNQTFSRHSHVLLVSSTSTSTSLDDDDHPPIYLWWTFSRPTRALATCVLLLFAVCDLVLCHVFLTTVGQYMHSRPLLEDSNMSSSTNTTLIIFPTSSPASATIEPSSVSPSTYPTPSSPEASNNQTTGLFQNTPTSSALSTGVIITICASCFAVALSVLTFVLMWRRLRQHNLNVPLPPKSSAPSPFQDPYSHFQLHSTPWSDSLGSDLDAHTAHISSVSSIYPPARHVTGTRAAPPTSVDLAVAHRAASRALAMTAAGQQLEAHADAETKLESIPATPHGGPPELIIPSPSRRPSSLQGLSSGRALTPVSAASFDGSAPHRIAGPHNWSVISVDTAALAGPYGGLLAAMSQRPGTPVDQTPNKRDSVFGSVMAV
ncbi:hypothetical protein FA95DRAFT_1683943 [Auriscalpium vulgare]|uniref:Uncharacterized protein n=1 Tax=Auriscalpium vulgare TaxID=40419 RepID=A0ACB8R976_9AGAM|nr:hypothetical protein FA95DRAFT_1683943 [Auriscalpium vulgare]